MIRDDTRQTIKFIIWVIIFIIIFYLGSIFVFYQAGKPSRDSDKEMAKLASQQTPIRNIQTYYHLDRGVSSYSLKGTSSKGQTYYFIFLPHSKKAYLYSSKKSTSEAAIRNSFKLTHANRFIKAINLGWYQGKPAWEVAYQNKNGNLGYSLYDFKNGKEINQVDNL